MQISIKGRSHCREGQQACSVVLHTNLPKIDDKIAETEFEFLESGILAFLAFYPVVHIFFRFETSIPKAWEKVSFRSSALGSEF